ncbi:SH3 domain-containing protein [Sulfitobacter geojensis]|uniref:SH3 domain-containing protein n=2 Tax=Sulfitobacter geojensis TaxID=1342299 RepID=A0AAE3B7K2_9RHOB|nr:SH3 domain-containing protein [Sulfitobacter geojensis]MBM1695179.1 SH3 domain-containing protein [Sulfitobacter geojensis]MBM1707252.1 SH3 domain-containing protein [Sulfitobacter geojensis]MBM1711402.1 SH3 domain-containing protein [Sulfitobacter geojensis]MBM1715377.1 SH3 domain-containing protein [Sulfitobacter geojensis]
MLRFIFLSFGFLGWSFYEMSGGSDFDAEAIRAARLAAAEEPAVIVQKEIVTTPQPVVLAAAPKVVVDTDPPLDNGVTRVSLNLTTLGDVSSGADREIVPQNASLVTSSADTPAIIPSLIDPNDGVSNAVSIPTSAAADIRTVSGNRVNVRGGPGTDFGVVSRLVRGDEVKIIQDDGNGWVRFEPLDGGTGGWMADFLLTNG